MTKKQGRRTGRKKGARGRRSTVPVPTQEYRARTAENRAALVISRSFKGPNNKYINTLFNQIATSATLTAPVTLLLNGVAQGTTENTRIGRLAKMRWLDIDLQFYLTNTANYQTTVGLRFYIVVETTALGSALAPAQFFVDAANFSPLSQRDRTNRNASRFVVLYDSRPFFLGSPPTASGVAAPFGMGLMQPGDKAFSMHLPLEFSTDYSRGNAGTVADIDTNSLYLLFVTDTGTGGVASVEGGWTLCFNDDS